MTTRELEKRVEQLEKRVDPEVILTILICCVKPRQRIDGWSHEGVTYWRETNETDEALKERIRTEINPEPGTFTFLHSEEKPYEQFESQN
jgi:hypothetical protein